jgi:hypothetical protein
MSVQSKKLRYANITKRQKYKTSKIQNIQCHKMSNISYMSNTEK